jgi:hypothetical protein
MERVYFEYDEQKENFDLGKDNELLVITCYHHIFQKVFKDFTKKFTFFNEMLNLGKKDYPDFFEAMRIGMLAHERAKGREK